MSNYVPPEVEELANQIGSFIQFWGFKNVQGRIWAHLFLSDSPLDAAEIMKRLQISKALVSISVKEMLEYEVVFEVGKSERGTILYQANPDQEQVIMNVLRRRERVMLAKVNTAYKLCEKLDAQGLKSGLRISNDKLKRLGQIIQDAESLLDCVLSMPNPGSKTWGVLASAASVAANPLAATERGR